MLGSTRSIEGVQNTAPEPWLRGTHSQTPAVLRAVLHALELAQEDLLSSCGQLRDEEVNLQPHGLTSVAFHLRHIAGSIDRLLTYSEGKRLSREQIGALKSETDQGATREMLLSEIESAFEHAKLRIASVRSGGLEAPRTVGSKQLPSTVGGLMVHIADHTQRHVGQAVTTAKLIVALRGEGKENPGVLASPTR